MTVLPPRNSARRGADGSARRHLAVEAGATLRLALPLMGGQLAQMAAGVVEVMLAGHLGPAVLGAVAVGNAIWTLAVGALIGVLMAVSPSVAQLDGAGRRDETASLFIQAAWTALALGVLLGAAMVAGGPWLARQAGIDPALHGPVRDFLHAVSLGAPGLGLFLACRGLSDGLSRTRTSMAFALLGLAVLAPLGWAMMYGRLGLPALGAQGAGFAAAAMCWIEGLAFTAWLVLSRARAGLGWQRVRLRPDPAAIGALLRLGVPMAVSVLLEMGLFSASALVIAGFGPVAVAGHQVALNVAALCFMMPLGLGMAITVRIGNAVRAWRARLGAPGRDCRAGGRAGHPGGVVRRAAEPAAGHCRPLHRRSRGAAHGGGAAAAGGAVSVLRRSPGGRRRRVART